MNIMADAVTKGCIVAGIISGITLATTLHFGFDANAFLSLVAFLVPSALGYGASRFFQPFVSSIDLD